MFKKSTDMVETWFGYSFCMFRQSDARIKHNTKSRYIMTTRLYKWPLYPGNPNVIGPLTLTFDLVSNLGLSSHASATYSKSFDLCAPRCRHASHRGHVTCVLNLYHAEVIVTWVKIQRSRVLFNVIEHVSLIYTSAIHHLMVCDA